MQDTSAEIPQQAAKTISTSEFDAFILDLDGVVTRTAGVHAAAWKELFDEYLRRRSRDRGEPFRSFDADIDYHRYVDGKPRYQGVKSFLESRGIELPWGDATDPAGRETVCGLGNQKNELFVSQLQKTPPEVYPAALDLVRAAEDAGLKVAIVTASKNCDAVLEAAGISELFPVRVDGNDVQKMGLSGKPAPDSFLEAARRLHVRPERGVVVEDALVGVAAGRAGRFGLVVGVDRLGHSEGLRAHGADVVVSSLSELTLLGETP